MTQPKAVTFYSNMGIEAARKSSRVGGGWRLYVLAKALDRAGLGMVKRDDLHAFASSLGVTPRTWERWITEARNASLVTDWQRAEERGGEWMLSLTSAGKAGYALGCETIGRKIEMQASDLIGKGWKARVYTAWENGKQISREQIQKSINVSVRAQKYRAGQMGEGYERQSNYAKSDISADNLAGIQENTNHKGAFVTRDGKVAWRLPDTRTAAHAVTLGKGRARKANKLIRQFSAEERGNSLLQMQQAFSDGASLSSNEFVRLFNSTPEQRKATDRKLSLLDSPVREVYERAETAKSGAQFWKHCPRW